MSKLNDKMKYSASKEALETMQSIGGQWFAYQNVDLGHPELGHLTFLKCGKDCTFPIPPKVHPDTNKAIMWRYHLIGEVDLGTGTVTSHS